MVSSTAIKRSRVVMVVADYLKFERKAPMTICSLRDVDLLFTDAPLAADLVTACEGWSTQVVLA